MSPPALPKSVAALEGLLRARGLGPALAARERLRPRLVPSGIERVDSLLGGGLPRGAISEVAGPCSSGRTALALAALARATRAGEIAAYVDATDCLDPRSAARAGVLLERLLWVRCGRARGLPAADEAWSATHLAASSGGFGVIAVDLGGFSRSQLGAWQRRTWARLRRALEGTPAALIVLSGKRLAGAAADTVLELRRERAGLDGLLDGAGIRAEVIRHRAGGPPAGRAR